MALGTVLEQIYEEDFLGFSYGFRPQRSQHHALDALAVGIRQRKVNWLLDADIQGFFDNLAWDLVMRAVRHHTDVPWILLSPAEGKPRDADPRAATA
jgi:retron-type reverse transcriptase